MGDGPDILAINQSLLDAIDRGDWTAYSGLVAEDLTCFEPEALGQFVTGLPFHRFYFEIERSGRRQSTMASPHVRRIGADVAVLCYVRLIQTGDHVADLASDAVEETRVWERRGGQWVNVHLHRSRPPV